MSYRVSVGSRKARRLLQENLYHRSGSLPEKPIGRKIQKIRIKSPSPQKLSSESMDCNQTAVSCQSKKKHLMAMHAIKPSL
jgi:hypothetical protein